MNACCVYHYIITYITYLGDIHQGRPQTMWRGRGRGGGGGGSDKGGRRGEGEVNGEISFIY